MANLTTLVDADIAAISEIYGFEITRYQPIYGGDENSSFLLKTHDQEYVITFSEKRSFSEVEKMVLLLNHLTEHGYHTNRVIPGIHGCFVYEFLSKPMILKTWIPGETLRDTDQEDYRSIGQAIAQLHDIPPPDFLPREHSFGLRVMPDALDHKVDLEYEAWLADKIAFLKDNLAVGLPQALIHGDLFDDNIIYHKGQFQAIIDFGDASCYSRSYDLGSVLFGACMADGRLEMDRARGVLEGYQSQMKLESEERDAVQFFSVYAGAAISAWHYLHTYVRKPLETRLDKYKLAAARTDHLFKLPPEIFDSLLD